MKPIQDQTLRDIESSEFYASQNLASTVSGFIGGLDASTLFASLQAAVSAGRLSASQLQERIEFLCADQTDEAYESPFDVALAAYLLVLSRTNPVTAIQPAKRISESPRLWWAAKLAATLEERGASAFVTLTELQTPSVSPVLNDKFATWPASFVAEAGEREAHNELIIWATDCLPAEVAASCQSSANGTLAFGTYASMIGVPAAVVAQWALGRV